MTVQLGNRVVEDTSGFSGIIVAMAERLNGNIQFAIQPSIKPGETTLPEIVWFDKQTVSFMDGGLASKRIEPDPASYIPLGKTVHDIISGFTGVVTEEVIHLNGCVTYSVTAEYLNTETGKPIIGTFDSGRLKISDVINEAAENIKQTGTGGFGMRGMPSLS